MKVITKKPIVRYHFVHIGIGQLVQRGLVIERFRNLGSVLDAVAHHCVLGKDT